MNRLGYFTDNGAFYNFNKWAGNLNRRWRPEQRSDKPAYVLTRVVKHLKSRGLPIAYVQLDDWWYDGWVLEGAVGCVREWVARPALSLHLPPPGSA